MGKLEITYEIIGFDGFLYNQQPSWQNCEFSMEKENVAMLRIWEDGINDSSQIEIAKNRIEQRVKSFILALEFSLSLFLTSTKKRIDIPAITTEDGAQDISETNFSIDEVSASVSPAMPPEEMPSLPLECEPWILTLAEVKLFEQCVEEQLKRHYLIIEELWNDFEQEFDTATRDITDQIKLVRDFVSHAECYSEKVKNFVSNYLPTSIQHDGNNYSVKFFRNDNNHRNFVARFEEKSREIARILVEK
jgi:hypothetical protein